MKNLRLDDPVVTLEIEGKQMDSVAFAQKIEQMGVEGVSHIQFVIGGSLDFIRSLEGIRLETEFRG